MLMLVMFDVVVLACDVSSLGECSKRGNITSYQESSTWAWHILITFLPVASYHLIDKYSVLLLSFLCFTVLYHGQAFFL